MMNAKPLILLLLAGCAHSGGASSMAAGAATRAESGPVVTMDVEVLSQDGQAMDPLAPGHELPAGARYAAKVTVGLPAYLYLVEVDAKGGIGRVVQGASRRESQLLPNAIGHIPSDGSWLSQTRPGKQELVLLSSPERLSETDVLNGAQLPSSAAVGKDRDPPPQEVTEKKRGGVIVRQQAKGVTVARFAVVLP